jgi:hypothetical protein
MDLRQFPLTIEQRRRAFELLKAGYLRYQPFIIADDIEGGAGQTLSDCSAVLDHVFDDTAYYDAALHSGPGRLAADPVRFRARNAEWRRFFEVIGELIAGRFGKEVASLSIGEIGCNAGLHLFNLARLGAASCTGYDRTDFADTFELLNEILGTAVRFELGNWDSLTHRFEGALVSEHDLMISGAVLNHQSDPLQHLAFVCDRARRAVLLWVQTAPELDRCGGQAPCALVFPDDPTKCLGYLPFPHYFNAEIRFSEALLRVSLRELGFENVEKLMLPCPNPGWQSFTESFPVFLATRTDDRKSAFWDHPAFRDQRHAPEAAVDIARVADRPDRQTHEARATIRADLAGGTAICSGANAGSPERAFDGNHETFWTSAERGLQVKGRAWLGYAFVEPQAVCSIRVAQTSNRPFRQDRVLVQASRDGGLTWQDVVSEAVDLSGGQVSVFDLPKTIAPAQAWRVVAAGDNAKSPGDAWTLYELGFFIDAAERPSYPAIALQGEPISSGYGSDTPERAFDGSEDSFWVSPQRGAAVAGEAWIGYAFGEPQAVQRIRLRQTSNPPFRQDVVRVENSVDGGSSWTAAAPGPFRLRGDTSWLDLPVGDAARHWRIVAAGDNATDPGHAWSIYEIAFFRAADADVSTEAGVTAADLTAGTPAGSEGT